MTSTATIPEQTDYPTLALGHGPYSCRSVNIVGLDVKVYGLDEINNSNLPLAAVIATHGRCNNQKQMAYFAYGTLGHISSQPTYPSRKRDTIVVTVVSRFGPTMSVPADKQDQRNHGERTVDRTANLSYDKNPKHLVDMAACIVGGCQDVSLIIDFLEPYLFPSGEKSVEEWIATGISLGGNLTWRLLQCEPRINIAIPIIGLPWDAFHLYLGARARNMGLSFAPPLYPASLRPLLETPRREGCYAGKKILTIHGSADSLVPFEQGREQIEAARSEANTHGGEMEVWTQQGAGHVVTTDMIQRVAEWIWRFALQP